ncbi:Cyclin-dependent kinase 11B [Smittium mucronatum]|uniref:cyclin-dependent kinase n=1 Tax=Smittium mucronatum TaxID=133383 RepID=A0A1R0GLW7_9FUNG|nr:Cyclin-dependent kinase 11B [Smittium mucronatum]
MEDSSQKRSRWIAEDESPRLSDKSKSSFHNKSFSKDSSASKDKTSNFSGPEIYHNEVKNSTDIIRKRVNDSSVDDLSKPKNVKKDPVADDFQKNSSFLGNKMATPSIISCRNVDKCYERLNKIEEGTYGVVYRAKEISTGEIVALKHIKLNKDEVGFPITSLREIYTLQLAKHPNIVNVREIITGSTLFSVYIVMDYVEHDLKSLMTGMRTSFLQSEIKTLMLQLLSAVAFLHDNWILHRDLKTSNLLMNNEGQIKVADFGLARKYSSPLGQMTQLVVTLWYRAPELLFGIREYSTAVDMWSVGCIFAELIDKNPLFPGRSEIDQISKVILLFKNIHPKSTPISFDGKKIISLKDLDCNNFEAPLPKDPSLFPTWPSKSSGDKIRVFNSPSASKNVHNEVSFSHNNSSPEPSIFEADSIQSETSIFKLKI